jgi:uncharacterized phage protein gp47/JayE
MPFNRPTLPQLLLRVQQDIATRLPGTNPFLRWSPERVLGSASAGLAHELHGYLQYLSQQIVPNVAMDDSFADRWAAVWLRSPTTLAPAGRKPASEASGTVTIVSTDAGLVSAETTVFQRSDGALFNLDSDLVTADGTHSNVVNVTAVVAGSAGNCDPGSELTFQTPLAFCNDSVEVDPVDGITGGQDVETTPALVGRILQAIQSRTQSGAPGDYVGWALSQPGVTRAWEVRGQYGLGTVGVLIASDVVTRNDGGVVTSASVAASDDLVAAVQAYIDSVAPETAQVYVASVEGLLVDIEIQLLTYTEAYANAITNALYDAFLQSTAAGRSLEPVALVGAIAAAAGYGGFLLSEPSGLVVPGVGQVPVVGTITIG